MKILKVRPGTPIRNPADPLAPPIGYVADGFASIVFFGPDDSEADVLEKCRLIHQQQTIARRGAKHRVDRKKRLRKNSG